MKNNRTRRYANGPTATNTKVRHGLWLWHQLTPGEQHASIAKVKRIVAEADAESEDGKHEAFRDAWIVSDDPEIQTYFEVKTNPALLTAGYSEQSAWNNIFGERQ